MQLLHTMIRVGDLDKSIAFYTEVLGMKLLRKSVNEEYKYTLAFVGYGDEKDHSCDRTDLQLGYGNLLITAMPLVIWPLAQKIFMRPVKKSAKLEPKSSVNRVR